jgi:subtilisin family serine protease
VSVRIAVIDSGIHAAHPHVERVAGGVGFDAAGRELDDWVDRLGHGTAVAAAIREKAPAAELYAVKVFHEKLATRIDALIAAIAWSARHGMRWINLSLGTPNFEHAAVLRDAVARAGAAGATIVAAYEDGATPMLPGRLPGVVAVQLDWTCPRHQCRRVTLPCGTEVYRASGYPRDIPGVPPDRNLRGISFAVATVTGLLAATD